ncbi:MAG: phosphoribosylformylglycinamidine synthase subunit PurS [Candidatus Omnitrophica bacterium]|nr:phosphoribosylformylglycinamidine synthase subunit PurS [Candidatus Omnitrophota bacterium]
MKAKVLVRLKPSVSDPQGQAVQRALKTLGFEGVEGVRVGKLIEVELSQASSNASKTVQEMCDKLLANPVIEDYTIDVLPGGKTFQ